MLCVLGGHCECCGFGWSQFITVLKLPSNLGSGSWCGRNLQGGAPLWALSLGYGGAEQWKGAGLQVQLVGKVSQATVTIAVNGALTIAAVILKQRERQSLESSCQLSLLPLTAWGEGPSFPPHFLVSLILGLWHEAGWLVCLSPSPYPCKQTRHWIGGPN